MTKVLAHKKSGRYLVSLQCRGSAETTIMLEDAKTWRCDSNGKRLLRRFIKVHGDDLKDFEVKEIV